MNICSLTLLQHVPVKVGAFQVLLDCLEKKENAI